MCATSETYENKTLLSGRKSMPFGLDFEWMHFNAADTKCSLERRRGVKTLFSRARFNDIFGQQTPYQTQLQQWRLRISSSEPKSNRQFFQLRQGGLWKSITENSFKKMTDTNQPRRNHPLRSTCTCKRRLDKRVHIFQVLLHSTFKGVLECIVCIVCKIWHL